MKFYKFNPPVENSILREIQNSSEEEFVKLQNWRFAKLDSVPNRDELYAVIFLSDVMFYWIQNGRPFYRIYPGLAEAMIKIKDEKFLNYAFDVPFNAIAFELSRDTNIGQLENRVESFVILHEEHDNLNYYGIVIQVNDGDKGTCAFFTFRSLSELREKMLCVYPELYRLIVGIFVIGNNPDFLRPIVLEKDKEKFLKSGDKKYVDKARRYGINGYDVGSEIPTSEEIKKMVAENTEAEKRGKVAPHVRAAHLGLYWTGVGRTIPRIVMVRQSLVNWKIVETLPHGFYGEVTQQR